VFVFLIVFASARVEAQAQGAPGTITSVAGTEGCNNLAADPAGNLYFQDEQGHIRKLAAETGKITTVSERMGGALAVDAAGNIYIANGWHGPLAFTVQKVAAGTGVTTTVAGTQENYNGLSRRIGGPAPQAFLRSPDVLALDSAGNLFIGEDDNLAYDVLQVSAATGVITGVRMNWFPAKRGDPVDEIATRPDP
jgi:hypothetical protein